MKTQRFFASCVLFFLTTHLHAITDTWDGGGADSSIGTAANWVDNTAPISNLFNTDLIFGGNTRLNPSFNSSFNANSLTFNNTSGAFTFTGSFFNVGAGGITNNDTSTQTFSNIVQLGADSSLNATSGILQLGIFSLNDFGVTVAGSNNTNITTINGSGTIIKNGSGTLSVQVIPTGVWNLTLNSGTFLQTGASVSETLASGSTIDILGGTYTLNKNLTIHGTVTIAPSGTFAVNSGKSVTISNGGELDLQNSSYHLGDGAQLNVTGAGTVTGFGGAGEFSVGDGGSIAVSSGGTFAPALGIELGAGGTGTMTVTGGSSTVTSFGSSVFGKDGGTATATFDSGAQGSFGSISLADGNIAGSLGTLNVSGGSNVKVGALFIGGGSASATGVVTVSGSGSSIVQNSTSTIIGFGSGAQGTLKVINGGSYTSSALFVAKGSMTVDGTGSLYQAKGNVTVNGGPFTVSNGASFILDSGLTMTVKTGADAIFTDANYTFGTAANYAITGAGSTFTNPDGDLIFNGGSAVAISAGGLLSAAGGIHLGAQGSANLSASGSGSTFATNAFGVSRWGSNGGTATVTLSNGASASAGLIELGSDTELNTSGAIQVQSGATLDVRGLSVAAVDGAGTGNVVVDGPGSLLNFSGANSLTLGSITGGSATFTVQNGGTASSLVGAVTVNASGTLKINGGTFEVQKLIVNGGQLTRDLDGSLELANGGELIIQNGGHAQIDGFLHVLSPGSYRVTGTGSVLNSPQVILSGGSSLLIENGGDLTTGELDIGTIFGGGTVTVDGIGSSVTATGSSNEWGFGGGSSTVTFSNGATGSFKNVSVPSVSASTSTLSIASGADVTMQSLNVGLGSVGGSVSIISVSGAGSSLTLSNALNLGGAGGTVTSFTVENQALLSVNSTSIATTGVLTIDGGFANLGTVTNAGRIDFKSGSLSAPNFFFNNNAGGEVIVAGALNLGTTLTNAAGGRISMGDSSSSIAGAGSVQNSGLVAGDGSIKVAFQNKAGGEVRVENGKKLVFTGSTGVNVGKYTMQGGTAEFSQAFTNGATGQINGRGALVFGAGAANQGAINLSGGFTDVFGSVNQTGTGKVIVSGGATATFYDNFTHNGLEFRTSVASSSVFFGNVNGAGVFTGPGEVYFEGGYSPGNSPAIVTLGSAITFTPSNILTMEIGGLLPGPGTPTDNGYDKLIFTNAGMPMVTWGGTLRIDLINSFVLQSGQVFDLFDFDPARDAGMFASMELAAGDVLAPGLSLDFSQLYNNGTVSVIPEPSSGFLMAIGLGLFLFRKARHGERV